MDDPNKPLAHCSLHKIWYELSCPRCEQEEKNIAAVDVETNVYSPPEYTSCYMHNRIFPREEGCMSCKIDAIKQDRKNIHKELNDFNKKVTNWYRKWRFQPSMDVEAFGELHEILYGTYPDWLKEPTTFQEKVAKKKQKKTPPEDRQPPAGVPPKAPSKSAVPMAGCQKPLDPHEPEYYDLNECPSCGRPADNGHDREIPPKPYNCRLCVLEDKVKDLENDLW